MAKLQTLRSALPVLDTRRVQTMQAGSWRTSDQTAAQRGYGYKWQKAREQFQREHPLCLRRGGTGIRSSARDEFVASVSLA